MCLAVPGRVVRWLDDDPICALAEVEFGGITRRCHMACVRDAQIGEYVVVHAGVAISKIDPVEAEKALAEIATFSEVDEWPPPDELTESPT